MSLLARRVFKHLHEIAIRGGCVEGLRQSNRVLIDAGDVIVHVCRPETRGFCNLGKMRSARKAYTAALAAKCRYWRLPPAPRRARLDRLFPANSVYSPLLFHQKFNRMELASDEAGHSPNKDCQ
jgi:hypothetical protein